MIGKIATKEIPYIKNRIPQQQNSYIESLEFQKKDEFGFFSQYVEIFSDDVAVINSSKDFARSDSVGNPVSILSINRINEEHDLNRFFKKVNSILPKDGYFIGSVETLACRRERLTHNLHGFFLKFLLLIDFLVHRMIPKLSPLDRIYYKLNSNLNRAMSLTETLGRLTFSGFEVVDFKTISGLTYFVVKKTKEPFNDTDPTYGPLIRLKRYGKEGRLINVYKFRTMHPYSEYLQDFIFKQNSLKEGGKFDNDFRITSWGKFLRKYWLDELPMIINVLKGELKLVGVRPLSQQYFQLYPEIIKVLRKQYKPGLIPPYYADLPKTFPDIVTSEHRYLKLFNRHPYITDSKYLYRAVKNIFINEARSS